MPDAKPLSAHEIATVRVGRLHPHDRDWLATLAERDKALDEVQASAVAWTHTATERGLALAEARAAAQMHHDERQREVAALTEERDCLTRELDEERLADIEVQEIIGRYAADNVRLARDLADAITECQRLCGDDEKVCDILERVDPTLLDYDETPGCVEALAKRLAGERDTVKILATSTRALLTRAEDAESKLAERDGVIETLQFQNAELDFEAGGVLSSLAYQKRELAEARAALQGAKDNLDANDELRAWAILRTALAPSDQKGDRQS